MPLVVEGEREVLVVCANRAGEEEGESPFEVGGVREGDGGEGVRYAGSSWVGWVGKGRVRVLGLLGRGVEGVLVGDTDGEAQTFFDVGVRFGMWMKMRGMMRKARGMVRG